MIVYVTNFFHPQIVTWRQISPPPYSAYQILILPNPKLRFHFLNQRLKLYLALFLAIGVNVPSDTLTVNCWSVSPFPHVFADLVDRARSALAILGLVGLKFHRFRLVRAVRGFLCLAVFIVTGGVKSGHICAEDCADCLVNLLGCISFHLLGAMRVHIESEACLTMPDDFGQCLGRYARIRGV